MKKLEKKLLWLGEKVFINCIRICELKKSLEEDSKIKQLKEGIWSKVGLPSWEGAGDGEDTLMLL